MIVTRTNLDEFLRQQRRRKLRIVFTNGVFDIIHRGHVDYLTKAARLGDLLIVAVNTDASVRRLKGPDRPLNRLADRMAVLDALKPVGAVVSFSELTPLRLIRRVRPDVLVKGADYALTEIVGAEDVLAAGGEVHRIKLTPGRSTSRTIARLHER